jgi:hypothetical protein
VKRREEKRSAYALKGLLCRAAVVAQKGREKGERGRMAKEGRGKLGERGKLRVVVVLVGRKGRRREHRRSGVFDMIQESSQHCRGDGEVSKREEEDKEKTHMAMERRHPAYAQSVRAAALDCQPTAPSVSSIE